MAQNFLTEARSKFAEFERTIGGAQSVAALEEALDLCDDIPESDPREMQIAKNLVSSYKKKTIEIAKSACDKKEIDYEKLLKIIAVLEVFLTRAPEDELRNVIGTLGNAWLDALLPQLSTKERESLFAKYPTVFPKYQR